MADGNNSQQDKKQNENPTQDSASKLNVESLEAMILMSASCGSAPEMEVPHEAPDYDLFREAGFAATGFVLTVFLLWYFVWRANREPRTTRRREFVAAFETPLHEQATAAATGGDHALAKTPPD